MKIVRNRVARVFPRKTTASPEDSLAFFGPPPIGLEVNEVHISTTFTYDKKVVDWLYEQWKNISPVCKVGGPAMDDPGNNFIPGRYLKKGYVITSRGCPNNCWFCSVPKREGGIRELPITKGWNLLDSNILACSDIHIKKVFQMLKSTPKPKGQSIQLTGGLEAKILTNTHVDLLWTLRPAQMFFAYDTPDDLEPLIEAGKKLRYANFTRFHLRCYVLIGYPKDTLEQAEKRLIQTWDAGFLPMAMLWKSEVGKESKEWRKFQRTWARPAATKQRIKKLWEKEFKK